MRKERLKILSRWLQPLLLIMLYFFQISTSIPTVERSREQKMTDWSRDATWSKDWWGGGAGSTHQDSKAYAGIWEGQVIANCSRPVIKWAWNKSIHATQCAVVRFSGEGSESAISQLHLVETNSRRLCETRITLAVCSLGGESGPRGRSQSPTWRAIKSGWKAHKPEKRHKPTDRTEGLLQNF